MAHKNNRRDRTPKKLKQLQIDSNESEDYSDSPESVSSDEDGSTYSSSSSSSSEGSGDEESLDLSSSEDTSEQYQKLRTEYQKMSEKYEELRAQYGDLVKSSTSARKLDRKSNRKRRGRSTKTSRATRASELSSSPTNFPRAYSAVKAPKKSEFMIDPNMPLSERMARRHVSHLSSDFIMLKTKSEEINLQKSRESPRPKSSQLSHSSASTTSNPLFQNDILSNCFINELDERGVTPLIHAIEFGDTELLRNLIDEQGADPNVPNSEGEAPLLIAMKKRRPDIALLLLERHADVNATVPLLLNTPLHLCFLEEIYRPEFVDQLMHHQELEVDAQNNLGNTPLFLAVYAKEVLYVTMLLQRGANVHLRNKHGVTPLLTACEIGALECAEQLLTFGADVNNVDNHGESGLHKAAKHGHERVVEMLLQRKINPRIENNMRSRAIDLPSTHRIKKLLEDYDPGTRAWKWETAFNEVNFDRNIILGDGEFGTVFKGALHGTPVAVKMLKMDINRIDPVTKQSFEYEVGLMSEIHHPNILMFLGASTTDEGVPCIITEYLERGSLRKFLMKELTWPNVLKCAITTARGMAWLHSRKPIILHRDLHTNNILVADSGECKVADFGLSAVQGSILASNKIYKRIRPPEVENKIQLYSRESDVYMYGLVLFELLTKKKASRDNTTYEHFRVLKEEYQLSPTVITFLSIIEECAATDPQKRPDFETILASLESLEAQKDVFVDEQAILSSIQRKGLDSAKNYGKPSKNNNTNETNNINNAGANILSFSGRAYYVEGEDGEDGDELSKMGKLNAPKYE